MLVLGGLGVVWLRVGSGLVSGGFGFGYGLLGLMFGGFSPGLQWVWSWGWASRLVQGWFWVGLGWFRVSFRMGLRFRGG